MSASSPYAAPKWTEAEDALLLRVKQRGAPWETIRREHFPERTARALKARHSRLVVEMRGKAGVRDPLEAERKRAARANARFMKRFNAFLEKRTAQMAEAA